MNRQEKEKYDVATGKKTLDIKEIERRDQIKKEKRDLDRKRWFVILSSVIVIILIVVGINGFKNHKEQIIQEKEFWPPNVEKPTEADIAKINNEVVCFETNHGTIKMELYPKSAPLTVNNFLRLVADGSYDNSVFHRVIDDFMVQGGQLKIAQGDTLEQVEMPIDDVGYAFKDEINPWSLGLTDEQVNAIQDSQENSKYMYDKDLSSYHVDYGYLCMANAGANTNSTQFFVVTKKEGCGWLDGRHTVFGKVTEGMDIVEEIQKIETNEADKPIETVVITRAWIEEKTS
ncbi:MAG: peptidylprolyl isomerase [Caldisericia bacterium]|nr:peptidylprolyl isomerase [Caldisericia bacterium]